VAVARVDEAEGQTGMAQLPGEVTDRSVTVHMTGALCTQPTQLFQSRRPRGAVPVTEYGDVVAGYPVDLLLHANPFGPEQVREVHEPLARRHFAAAFEAGVKVGQLRTRPGIEGWGQKGPLTSAEALFRRLMHES